MEELEVSSAPPTGGICIEKRAWDNDSTCYCATRRPWLQTNLRGPILHPWTLRLRSSDLGSLMPGPRLCCLEGFGGNAGRNLGGRGGEGQFGASQSPGLPQANLPLSRAPGVPLGRVVLPDVTPQGRAALLAPVTEW